MKKLAVVVFIALLTQIFAQILIPPPTDGYFTKVRTEKSKPPPEITYAYIYESCKHKGDSVPVEVSPWVLEERYALRTHWNFEQGSIHFWNEERYKNYTYKGFDDITGIFDCTITIKLGPHDKTIGFQELIFGFIYYIKLTDSIMMPEVIANITELDPDNTLANKGLRELQAACAEAKQPQCEKLGCLVIKYGNTSKTYCTVSTSNNIAKDEEPFTRDDVTIRILLVGKHIGKNSKGANVYINYPPFDPNINLDFTRLHAGPCSDPSHYWCNTHGVCIKYVLACDSLPMKNCPLYNNDKLYRVNDEPASTQCKAGFIKSQPANPNVKDSEATRNMIIFWALLGVLLSFIAYLLLNYLLWRPGYLVWRCGRLRNWCSACGSGNCCYRGCSKISKASFCMCCKSQAQFDKTDPITANWSKFAVGDGFHLRENR